MTTTIDWKSATVSSCAATLLVAAFLAGCKRGDPDEQIIPEPLSEPPQPEVIGD